MHYTLKKIGVQSFAKFYAVFLLFFSLIVAIPMGLMTISQNGAGGLLLMFGLPLGYGLLGFIAGLIFAAIFNFVASQMGGIELEVEKSR